MTVKDRAQFLIERYGQDSIQVISDLIETDDTDINKYWKEVMKLCKESLNKIKNESNIRV